MDESTILEVAGLQTSFFTDEGVCAAVNGISFNVERSRTVGIVGESGCGKTVASLSIMRLLHGTKGRITAGSMLYRRKNRKIVDIAALDPNEREMRSIRGNEISMIFQEPMTSLNPVFSIREQITEELRLHQGMGRREAVERAVEMLRKVRIPNPEIRVNDYPHQMSGGMRQRAMIAMSLVCNPQLLIADEPTTALDVTIEAQILRLMKELQDELGMSIIIISHNIGVIGAMADTINVMYAGRIVETALMEQLFKDTRHPYTVGLLESMPKVGHRERLTPIEGTVPTMSEVGEGCSFYSRCKKAMDKCRAEDPPAFQISEHHLVKCWLYQ